jgi:hypothetical protein
MAGVFVLLGVGSALFQSPNSTEVMNSLPRSQTGIASSVSAAVRNLGMTLGVALASLLLPLLLRLSGSTVSVLQADKGALAASVGDIMIVSGLVCLLAVAILAGRRSAAPAPADGSASGSRAPCAFSRTHG